MRLSYLHIMSSRQLKHHLRPPRLATLSHIAQEILITTPVDLICGKLVLWATNTLEVLCLCLPSDAPNVLAFRHSLPSRDAKSV